MPGEDIRIAYEDDRQTPRTPTPTRRTGRAQWGLSW
jgi:hypothetical protein